ncbi:hypothetical protein ACFL35_05905 [Candidatus Riflebacteria bacterium]
MEIFNQATSIQPQDVIEYHPDTSDSGRSYRAIELGIEKPRNINYKELKNLILFRHKHRLAKFKPWVVLYPYTNFVERRMPVILLPEEYVTCDRVRAFAEELKIGAKMWFEKNAAENLVVHNKAKQLATAAILSELSGKEKQKQKEKPIMHEKGSIILFWFVTVFCFGFGAGTGIASVQYILVNLFM